MLMFSVIGARGYPAANQRAGDVLRAGGGRRAPDLERARVYYRMAAERGDAGGQEALAIMMLRGQGGPRDPAAALSALRAGAALGRPQSQRALGLLLADGDEGVSAAPAEAVRWLELRVEDRAAALRLGRLLWYGAEGVPRDCPRALALVTEAVHHNDLDTYFELARWILEGGPGVPADPMGAQPRFNHAANRGHPKAMVALARTALEKDRALARVWLERAAKRGDAEAIAELERQGWDVPRRSR